MRNVKVPNKILVRRGLRSARRDTSDVGEGCIVRDDRGPAAGIRVIYTIGGGGILTMEGECFPAAGLTRARVCVCRCAGGAPSSRPSWFSICLLLFPLHSKRLTISLARRWPSATRPPGGATILRMTDTAPFTWDGCFCGSRLRGAGRLNVTPERGVCYWSNQQPEPTAAGSSAFQGGRERKRGSASWVISSPPNHTVALPPQR